MALADKLVTVEDLKAVCDVYKDGVETWEDIADTLTWDIAPYIRAGREIGGNSNATLGYSMAKISVSQGQQFEIFGLGTPSGTALYFSDDIAHYEYPAILSKSSTLATNSNNIFYSFVYKGHSRCDTNISGYSFDYIFKTDIIIPELYPYLFVFNYSQNVPIIIRKRIG